MLLLARDNAPNLEWEVPIMTNAKVAGLMEDQDRYAMYMNLIDQKSKVDKVRWVGDTYSYSICMLANTVSRLKFVEIVTTSEAAECFVKCLTKMVASNNDRLSSKRKMTLLVNDGSVDEFIKDDHLLIQVLVVNDLKDAVDLEPKAMWNDTESTINIFSSFDIDDTMMYIDRARLDEIYIDMGGPTFVLKYLAVSRNYFDSLEEIDSSEKCCFIKLSNRISKQFEDCPMEVANVV